MDRCASSVLVVVTFVGGVAMSVVDVIEVPLVLHSLMTAIGTVLVAVGGVFSVGEGVLVVVSIVLAVGVPIVDVVDVTIVVDRRVPAGGAVRMAVIIMDGVVVRGHGASLAWLTASATMCAT